MSNDVIDGKWKEFRGKIRTWLDKRSDTQPLKVNRERKQFAGILQNRYGYTEEQATSELKKHYSKVRFI